jgi:hypothetical protein
MKSQSCAAESWPVQEIVRFPYQVSPVLGSKNKSARQVAYLAGLAGHSSAPSCNS